MKLSSFLFSGQTSQAPNFPARGIRNLAKPIFSPRAVRTIERITSVLKSVGFWRQLQNRKSQNPGSENCEATTMTKAHIQRAILRYLGERGFHALVRLKIWTPQFASATLGKGGSAHTRVGVGSSSHLGTHPVAFD